MADTPQSSGKPAPWLTVERLGAFNDGVIAIIITILVLEIKVPEGHDFGEGGVVSLLYKVSRDVMVYFLSFCLIGVFWLQHHVMLHYAARTDRTFIFLNILFLFLLSLSPFSTNLAGAYRGVPAAEAVFGINLLLSGITLVLMWHYLVGKDILLRTPVSAAVVKSMRRRILIAPAVILLGMAVSVFDFHIAALVYFSIPLFYLRHRLVDKSWQSHD